MAFNDDIKRVYRTGGISVKFIMIFAAVFVCTLLITFLVGSINRDGASMQQNLYWLSGTAHIPSLITKPWTIVTNLFIHGGAGHFLGNMIGIYFFGRVLSQFVTDKDFTATLVLSGIFGFVMFVIIYNLLGFAENSSIVGASGCVMGILGASVGYAPMMRFNLIIVQPPLILIAGLYILFDLSTIANFGGNFGGSIAHVSGLAFGYASVKLRQNGTDILGWFTKLLESIARIFTASRNKSPKMKVKYSKRNVGKKKKTTSTQGKTKTDADYNVEKAERQAKIDAILDKIKGSGYESLSKVEKDYLFNEGKRL